MMAAKAKLFGDDKTLLKIMKANQPREQKRLGRDVSGFSVKRWNAIAKNVVFTGSMAKYKQNHQLFKLLVATTGTTLVEASPKDTLYGIGLTEDDPRALIREQWLGKNWLGEVLTNVRDTLLNGGAK